MAEQWWGCPYPPYEIEPRLALLLDLALDSGKPPLSLLDGGLPPSWTVADLEILSQWKSLREVKCPGCGRPLTRHLHNPMLGREETADDYIPWSIECPAQQAVSAGQEMWRAENKPAIDSYHKGHGPDPSAGMFWISQGQGEQLPFPTDE